MSSIKSLEALTTVCYSVSDCTRSGILYRVGEDYYTCSYGSTVDTCRDETITKVEPLAYYLEYLLLKERGDSYKMEKLQKELNDLEAGVYTLRTLITTIKSSIEKENK